MKEVQKNSAKVVKKPKDSSLSNINVGKKKFNSQSCIFKINTRKNNTLVTITNETGKETLLSMSCGKISSPNGNKYKNSQKNKPQVVQKMFKEIGEYLVLKGIQFIALELKYYGNGRDIQQLMHIFSSNNELKLMRIVDKTPLAHGGCKQRRAARK